MREGERESKEKSDSETGCYNHLLDWCSFSCKCRVKWLTKKNFLIRPLDERKDEVRGQRHLEEGRKEKSQNKRRFKFNLRLMYLIKENKSTSKSTLTVTFSLLTCIIDTHSHRVHVLSSSSFIPRFFLIFFPLPVKWNKKNIPMKRNNGSRGRKQIGPVSAPLFKNWLYSLSLSSPVLRPVLGRRAYASPVTKWGAITHESKRNPVLPLDEGDLPHTFTHIHTLTHTKTHTHTHT